MNSDFLIKWLVVSMFWFNVQSTSAQSVIDSRYNMTSEFITVDEGLSQNLVYVIHKDQAGFMWFGTKDGLNRFDGLNFKVFRHVTYDTTSLSSPYVATITEDHEGYFWLTSFENWKIDRFDPISETTQRFDLLKIIDNTGVRSHSDPDKLTELLKDGFIRRVLYQPDQTLYLLTSSLLLVYDMKSESIELVKHPDWDIAALRNMVIYDGHIWIAASGAGLFRVSKSTLEPSKVNIPEAANFTTAIARNGNQVYVANNGVIYQIEAQSESDDYLFKEYAVFNAVNRTPELHNLHFLSNGDLFLIYWGSLQIYRAKTGVWEETILHQNVTSLWADDNDLLWVGTNGLGFIKINLQGSRFQNYSGHIFDHLHTDIVSQAKQHCGYTAIPLNIEMIRENISHIWFAAGWNGLIQFDKEEDQLTCYQLYYNDSRLSLTLVEESEPGKLLIGADDKIFEFDLVKSRFSTEPLIYIDTPHTIILEQVGSYTITALHQTPDGRIWVGTATNGLLMYDLSTDSLFAYSELIEAYKTPSSQMILHLAADPLHPEQFIWIGTDGGGLNRLDLETNEFTYFTERDGFPNQVIYAILHDESGDLWMSSNRGLIRFNPVHHTSEYYDTRDGLINTEFNRRHFFRAIDGKLWFGGISGVTAFYPEDIVQSNYMPPVVISDISLFRESIYLDFIIQKQHQKERPLSFKHNQNMFSFDFASLDYRVPEKNRYRYRLHGFNTDWIEAGHERTAVYTNLPNGKYRFEVMGSNSDGVWNPETASVSFIITPPFWRTIWFRILLSAVFIGIISFTVWNVFRIRYRRKMSEMAYRMRLDSEKLRISRDMHDSIGARLTQIKLMTQWQQSETSRDDASGSKKLVNDITGIISEVIHQCSEMVWSLSPEHDTLESLTDFLVQYASDYVTKSGRKFRLQADQEFPKRQITSDARNNLLMVAKEALQNALKYSGSDDIVLILNYTESSSEFYMEIRDHGDGFNEEKLVRTGNGLRNMRSRINHINGCIKIKSVRRKGTSVCVWYCLDPDQKSPKRVIELKDSIA